MSDLKAEARLVGDLEVAARLLEHVRKFIKDHEIGHSETIYQSDALQLAGSEFMEACCEIAGYHKVVDFVSEEVNVDGHEDARGIRYIGKAHLQPDGKWRCLADVGGALCLVEVILTFQEKQEKTGC